MAKTRLPMRLSSVVRRVELVNAGRSPKKLARAFEPTAQSIKNWVAQPARNIGDGGAR
jgi:transposase